MGGPTNSFGTEFVAPSVEQLQAALPQYEILEIVGIGGMAAVYKARQPKLDRLIAIKILPPDFDDSLGMNVAERFGVEAQAMARLNHPRIISIYDFGETEGSETSRAMQYIVMEYVEGTTIWDLIQEGTLNQKQTLAILTQICDALHYAHTQNIVHRDIKPSNIMLTPGREIRIADFGLAKVMGDKMFSRLTQTRIALGTEHYASPEAVNKDVAIDHRTDIYALGVLLYEMLTGKVPRGIFQPASKRKEGVDPRLDRVVHKAMAPEPNGRYQTVAELWTELEHIASTPEGTPPLSESPKPATPRKKKKKGWFGFGG